MFTKVIVLDNYILELHLKDGSIKYFDMKPYLNKGDFKKLRDINLFKTVRLDVLEGIEWDYKNLSLSRDTLEKYMY